MKTLLHVETLTLTVTAILAIITVLLIRLGWRRGKRIGDQ